jgi:hypothetical protein
MKASAWLSAHEAGVPPALVQRLRDSLAARAGRDEEIPDAMVSAATTLLTGVLAARPMSRTHALDLLAADAFATYAFEAAADEPQLLAARARAAMQQFANAIDVPSEDARAR